MASRYRRTLMVTGIVYLLGAGSPISADSGNEPFYVLTGTAPPGFQELAGPQDALVDVYHGARRIATVLATYTLEDITFHDPRLIIDGLPPLADEAAMLAALARPMAQNAGAPCPTGGDTDLSPYGRDCASIPPDTVAVAFDPDRFRADLLLNPDLFAVQSPVMTRFLPAPETGFSTLHSFSAAAAGSDRSDDLVTLAATSIVAYDADRLVAQMSYSDADALAIDRLFVQRDVAGFEYVAGLFGSSSSALSFAPAPTLGGVRVASTLKTRTDLGMGFGTPINVSLSSRARVDILRDGRLVSSRFYEPGSQLLDTSLLPEGAYEVTIRINEGGRVREETVYFSKTSRLPPRDQPLYTFELGAVLDRFTGTLLPDHSGDWVARLAHSRRLTDTFGIDAGVAGNQTDGLLELGLFQIDRLPGAPGSYYQLQAGAFTGSSGSRGLHLHGQIRTGSVYAALDLRQVEGQSIPPDSGQEPDAFAPYATGEFSPLPRPLTQGSLTVQMPLLGGVATLALRESRPGFGPTSRTQTLSYRRPLLRHQAGFAELRTDINYQDDRLQALVGVRLYLRSSDLSGEIAPAFRYDDAAASPYGYQVEGTTAWNRETAAANVRVAASGITGGDSDSLALSGEMDHRLIRSGVALNHQRTRGESETSWAANLATSVVTTGADWGLGAQNQSDAAVLVTLDGESPDTEFEVLVDGYRRGLARGNTTTVLHLPAYRQYAVAIRPRRSAFVDYDDSPRTVTLYPGSVSRLRWAVDARMVILGRALLEDGRPLAHASLLDASATDRLPGARTDAGGYFQAEVRAQSDAVSLVFVIEGQECEASAPIRAWRGGVAFLEPVTCNIRIQPPGLQAGRP